MMLFDIIRDWFVQYIFGGVTSNGSYYSCTIGSFALKNAGGENFDVAFGDGLYFPLGQVYEATATGEFGDFYLSLSDWLSTTSTIIVLILMCVFLFLCVRYLFKVGAGLFSNLRG